MCTHESVQALRLECLKVAMHLLPNDEPCSLDDLIDSANILVHYVQDGPMAENPD